MSTTMDRLAFEAAEELGLRLEVVGGWTVWEAHPSTRHQMAVQRIGNSIRPKLGLGRGCGCVQLMDVNLRFLDGSLKRPDISVFCRTPDELDEAVKLLPEAVIEILSKDYERKDLELGAPFYLAQGVKDVIVLDPYSGLVRHFRADGEKQFQSLAEIELE